MNKRTLTWIVVIALAVLIWLVVDNHNQRQATIDALVNDIGQSSSDYQDFVRAMDLEHEEVK